MRQPIEQTLSLVPGAAQQVDLRPRFEADLLAVKDARSVEATVELEFESGGQILGIKKKQAITVYGRGALTWDTVGRAAAFITPTDPAVAAFGRPVVPDVN